MCKLCEDVSSNNKLKGDGKGIVEVLNIGFEPLLTEREYEYHSSKFKHKSNVSKLKRHIKKLENMMDSKPNVYSSKKRCIDLIYEIIIDKESELDKEKELAVTNEKLLKEELVSNIDIVRTVNTDRDTLYSNQLRHIAIFESDLARAFECRDREFSEDIISVVTYYTEIFDSIIHNGFLLNNEKFIFFTAGAGQTRNKKSTFVKESKFMQHRDRLFCGLTEEIINNNGGMNTNKYTAYTSLCQSNTMLWNSFDIDKSIVIDDIEFELENQLVRYINVETKEDRKYVSKLKNEISLINLEMKNKKGCKGYTKIVKELREKKKALQLQLDEKISSYYSIEEKRMSIPIPFTDGFGLILSKEPTGMARLPFIKGLMSYAPYSEFKKAYGLKSCKITDIYGKKHNVNNIKYIFTKSQFKMWSYFKSWEEYKENFKRYNCSACICNVEDNVKLNAHTNYQVLQTLTTEMTDDEILKLAGKDLYDLEHIGDDYKCMLSVLGATENTYNPSFLQQALIKYPEMLRDPFVRNQLINKKDSILKRMYSGKFNVHGAYTFIIPDVLACMQWWFLGERDLDKLGCVNENNVSCSLFEKDEKVDCLRSPHLDHAHCIRNNQLDDSTKKWFKTKGVYVGVKDNMSKLLMYDNDGDKALVHDNEVIIDCAERFQAKYPMIPNYYEMAKADAQDINNTNLFNGIVLAYHHGNIGTPSNDITGIWSTLDINSTREEIKLAIESVAIKTAMVNFTIDYAKTLWKPEIPKHISEQLKKCGCKKVPYFFQYAKDKTIDQCEPRKTGCIDRIETLIPNKRITFKNVLGGYSYKNLISDDVDIASENAIKIIDLYNDIHITKKIRYRDIDVSEMLDESKKAKAKFELLRKRIKNEMYEKTGCNDEYIVNVLVKALRADISKSTLFDVYGDIIIKNLQANIPSNTKLCEVCGERFEYNIDVKTPPLYCKACKHKKNLEKYARYNEKRQ